MSELAVSIGSSYQDQPVLDRPRRTRAPATSPRSSPGAANPMGYDDLKVIEAARFLRSVADGKPYGARPGRRGALGERPRRDGPVGGDAIVGCARGRVTGSNVGPWTAQCRPAPWSEDHPHAPVELCLEHRATVRCFVASITCASPGARSPALRAPSGRGASGCSAAHAFVRCAASKPSFITLVADRRRPRPAAVASPRPKG